MIVPSEAKVPTVHKIRIVGHKIGLGTVVILAKKRAPNNPIGKTQRLEINRPKNNPQTISGLSANNIGPGRSPCRIKAPIMIPVTGSPGTPSVSIGTRSPPTTELLPASEAVIPSIDP